MTMHAPQTELPGDKAPAPAPSLPPLEDGDHLTRAEFERRYDAMPHLKKAELIEGVVYMPSPVSLRHWRPDGRIHTWLGYYSARTAGTVSLVSP